jgi:DNA-binding transcriptional MerR regulator
MTVMRDGDVRGQMATTSPAGEYSLAELSAIAGVPSRTIRYYQSNGLLPKPGRRGNQAVYGDTHLTRLRSIAELQAKGLRLRTIRTMLEGPSQPGTDVVDLLGPDLVGSAWLRTSAGTLDEGELADLLGDAYPEQVSALVKAGYLERRTDADGRGIWYASSLPQLRGALEMLKLGTDIELSGWSAQLMRERFRELCEEFAVKWITESGNLYAGEATQVEFEANLEAIRSVVWQSAAHVIAEEIEAVIHRVDEIRANLTMPRPEQDHTGQAHVTDDHSAAARPG